MITILIPCAGEGRRFKEAGYDLPKPLIHVRGVPMLRRVIDNVLPTDARDIALVTIARHGHGIRELLRGWYPGLNGACFDVERVTDGAARTCLLAEPFLDPDQHLLIANCDQIVEVGIAPLLETDADAAVLTMFRENESRWSYADVGAGGRVLRVVEKPVNVSYLHRATTGHYYFRRAGDFFAAAECMIAMDDRTGGEFYVAPTLNYLIAARKKVVEVRVEDYGGRFVGLGTPEDLKAYEEVK